MVATSEMFHIWFCLWSMMTPLVLPALRFNTPYRSLSLTGALEPNSNLCVAERLFEGLLLGPESLAERDGAIYTGLQGGQVVRIEDGHVTPIAKFGQPCDGPWEEEKCGRPVGLDFDDDGTLVVADMYYGIFRVNLDTGNITQLVSTKVPINGKKPGLPNSLDVSSNGEIYWSDSTTQTGFRNSVIEFVGDASGRVLRYSPFTGKNKVILSGLRFPNSVQLSPDEDFLLVAETGRNRVLKYYLHGPDQGQVKVFAERLPGGPDGIRPSGRGSYFVSLLSPRDPSSSTLPQKLEPYPHIRGALVSIIRLLQRSLSFINEAFPVTATRRLTHVLGHTETVTRESQPRSVVVELDPSGKILSSLQCPSGDVRYVSEMLPVGDFYYLASPFNNYLGRIRAQ